MVRWSILAGTVVVAAYGVANAAPPPGGLPSLEESVARGCRAAETVVVAKVVNLRVKPLPHGEMRTGDVKVLRTLKGNAKNVPESISEPVPVPLMTDAFPVFLENNRAYVIFFFRGTLEPQILPHHHNVAGVFEKATALAEAACR